MIVGIGMGEAVGVAIGVIAGVGEGAAVFGVLVGVAVFAGEALSEGAELPIAFAVGEPIATLGLELAILVAVALPAASGDATCRGTGALPTDAPEPHPAIADTRSRTAKEERE